MRMFFIQKKFQRINKSLPVNLRKKQKIQFSFCWKHLRILSYNRQFCYSFSAQCIWIKSSKCLGTTPSYGIWCWAILRDARHRRHVSFDSQRRITAMIVAVWIRTIWLSFKQTFSCNNCVSYVMWLVGQRSVHAR